MGKTEAKQSAVSSQTLPGKLHGEQSKSHFDLYKYMLQISLRLGQLCTYHLLGYYLPDSLIFICKCRLTS